MTLSNLIAFLKQLSEFGYDVSVIVTDMDIDKIYFVVQWKNDSIKPN